MKPKNRALKAISVVILGVLMAAQFQFFVFPETTNDSAIEKE